MFFIQQATAQVPHFKPGTGHMKLGFDYFKTNYNYDPKEDNFIRLPNDKSYQIMHFTGQFQYFVSEKFSYAIYSSVDHAESDDRTFLRKDTNINRVGLSTLWNTSTTSWEIFPELDLSFSLKEVTVDTDEVIADDGALHLNAGVWVQKPFIGLFNYLYLGARYRNQDLSSLALYRLGTEKRFQRFLLGLEAHGYTPITDDGYTQTPTARSQITDRVNASSLYTFAINPTLHNLRLKTGYAFSKYVFTHLDVETTLIGKNAARGLSFYLALEFRNLFSGGDYKKKKAKSKRQRQKKKFQEDVEEYDEDLFRDPSSEDDEEEE